MAERAWAAREMALFSSWRVMRRAEKKPSVSWKRSLGLSCLRLTVPKSKKIRKAVITAAGYGTRLFP